MKLILVLLMCLFSLEAMSTSTAMFNEKKLMRKAKRMFGALPKADIDVKKNNKKIALGKKLYFESKLSANGKISCNSCHNLKTFGVDNEKTSPGHDGTRGGRNSPTTLNASLHIAQFWDGRAEDVEAQALGPLLNPIEHGLKDENEAMEKIDTEEYRRLFSQAFSNEKKPFAFKNIGKAIGAFERTLMTPSKFDDYMKGNKKALTVAQKRGLQSFIKVGCTTCHSGVAMGGGMYMKLGLVKEYKTKDLGRFEVTKNEADKHVFKVPSLRNIAKTAPYFHDGSVATLEEAIKIMAEYQLGKELTDAQVSDIKAFLESTTAKKVKI